MEVSDFLKQVVTSPEDGWLCLLIGPPTNIGWFEEWFRYPDELDEAIDYAMQEKERSNVYFSSHLFSEKDSHKPFLLPTRTIQADLDDADVSNLTFPPSILVETSPRRHQAFWIVDEYVELDVLEDLSKKLTYSIPDSDHSGWALGRKVRLPETLNYKYTNPHEVRILKHEGIEYSLSDFDRLPPVPDDSREKDDEDDTDANRWVKAVAENNPVFSESPEQIIKKYERNTPAGYKRLPTTVMGLYVLDAKDKNPEGRSGALWALMLSLFEAGADRDEVFYVAKNSKNNKFSDRRHAGDRDLAKDVLNAEKRFKRVANDPRPQIALIRRSPGQQSDKNKQIAELVSKGLSKEGDFYATDDALLWYLRHDTGEPVILTRKSDNLDGLLEVRYDLNNTEREHTYAVSYLISHTREFGKKAERASLSKYYEKGRNKRLLIHGGGKDVYHVTAEKIEVVNNGSHGTLFPWRVNADIFTPSGVVREDWTEEIFADYFNNLTGMNHEQANALVRVWLMFLLFRDAAINRPILSLFGQPGSGKSTLFRAIFAILYGGRKSLESVTTADNFDYAVATDPLVVLDNVDTWTPWLPDKLALSAATSEATKRKLYTDMDTVVLKRQALIGLTAHNPRFGREDVVDRMLLLFFDRIPNFIEEKDLIGKILDKRDNIWQALIHDAQRVLREPIPESDLPQFRISDFAKYGLWIARALDIEQPFREGLQATKVNQTSFNLSEEDILIEAIDKWVNSPRKTIGEYYTPGKIWESLTLSGSDDTFQKQYKNAIQLSKKLVNIEDSLSSVFDVDRKRGKSGTNLWKIDKRGDYDNGR